MSDFGELGALLGKLYGIWIVADVIVLVISTIFVWATGSLADLIGSLAISAALGVIPFPFDLLAIWEVAPLSIVFQIAVFFVLVVIARNSLSS